MWFIKMWKCALKILLKDIPTFLVTGGEHYIRGDSHLSNSQSINRQIKGEGQVRTFDLVNCGKRNRYTISNLIVHNSDAYGSGVKKKFRTLRLLGFDYTFEQVREMHENFQHAYKGAKDYGRALEREWKLNSGYVLNGLGIPVAVNERKLKDLSNMCCQSVGHQILMLLIYYILRELRRAGIPFKVWLSDFHDELAYQFRREDVERSKQIYVDATKWMNELLGADVIIKFEPQIAVTLAEIKCEGFKLEDVEMRELLEELN